MSFLLTYPVIVIRHGGGYASLASEMPDGAQLLAVAAFSNEQTLREFVVAARLEGEIEFLPTSEDFARFVRAMRPPAAAIAFDPEVTEEGIRTRGQVDVATLLRDFLPAMGITWNYPVYAIRMESGYACIAGETPQGPMIALALFDEEDVATAYRAAAEVEGEIESILDAPALVTFLDALDDAINAVAFDPQVTEIGHMARWCVRRAMLIDKLKNGK